MFRFVLLPCFDLCLTVPMYIFGTCMWVACHMCEAYTLATHVYRVYMVVIPCVLDMYCMHTGAA